MHCSAIYSLLTFDDGPAMWKSIPSRINILLPFSLCTFLCMKCLFVCFAYENDNQASKKKMSRRVHLHITRSPFQFWLPSISTYKRIEDILNACVNTHQLLHTTLTNRNEQRMPKKSNDSSTQTCQSKSGTKRKRKIHDQEKWNENRVCSLCHFNDTNFPFLRLFFPSLADLLCCCRRRRQLSCLFSILKIFHSFYGIKNILLRTTSMKIFHMMRLLLLSRDACPNALSSGHGYRRRRPSSHFPLFSSPPPSIRLRPRPMNNNLLTFTFNSCGVWCQMPSAAEDLIACLIRSVVRIIYFAYIYRRTRITFQLSSLS